ncbi:MAG: hypothetical protein V4607_02030 [Pseudomonadota bacterium]
MSISMSTALRNARLNPIAAAIDAGSGAGTLKFYTVPKPAAGAAITTQTLLATLTFADPSAPAAADGVLSFNAIASGVGAANGTATWARVQDSAGNFVMDLVVGPAGSGADIELISINILSGNTVAIATAALTEGNP